MQNIHFRRREGWVLLNWRDHSWLHLFRRDKVVCSNITMSAEGGGRSFGEWGIKERGIRARKGRSNGEKEAVRVNKNNSIQNKREPQRENRTRTKWKKSSSLWRCTVGIAVWAHFTLILHLLRAELKLLESRLHQNCKACDICQVYHPEHDSYVEFAIGRWFKVEYFCSFDSNIDGFIGEAWRMWRILQRGMT